MFLSQKLIPVIYERGAEMDNMLKTVMDLDCDESDEEYKMDKNDTEAENN